MKIEIKPLHLYYNRKELHLDPVHHLRRWIHVSRLETGPLFRRFDALDRSLLVGSYVLGMFDNFEINFSLQSSSLSTSETTYWI